MINTKQFGETVEGYDIPVLNEREIRAAAGILFLFMFVSWMLTIFKGNFLLIKYVNTMFLTDFIMRVFVDPKFAPSLIVGRLIVGRQNPEYVGAVQKKFAWTIGLVLAAIMFVLMDVLNSYSFITGIICLVCLTFLFFESAFGICLGCLFYGWFNKGRVRYCPGETCDTNSRQEIQKTSLAQVGIVIGFLAYISAMAYLLNDQFSSRPSDLWAMLNYVR